MKKNDVGFFMLIVVLAVLFGGSNIIHKSRTSKEVIFAILVWTVIIGCGIFVIFNGWSNTWIMIEHWFQWLVTPIGV